MNHLAHFYLSGNDRGLLIGNFIADHVKGKKWQEYPEEIQKGILLHRRIDHFTDSHPLVKESVKLFRPKLGKYSGVAVDVVYDHFLASNWIEYHSQDIQGFADNIYAQLEEVIHELPERSQLFFGYMVSRNILVNYRNLDTLDNVFMGMSHRSKFESNLEYSVPVLKDHYEELGEHFREFFQDLIQDSLEYKMNKPSPSN